MPSLNLNDIVISADTRNVMFTYVVEAINTEAQTADVRVLPVNHHMKTPRYDDIPIKTLEKLPAADMERIRTGFFRVEEAGGVVRLFPATIECVRCHATLDVKALYTTEGSVLMSNHLKHWDDVHGTFRCETDDTTN